MVRRDDLKAQLVQAAHDQDFLAAAPVCIVVCADTARSASRYRERGAELYCLQDTATAAQNLLLTATAYGLGSCWVGAFDEERVKEILGLDGSLRPVALIPVGYPSEEAEETPRRALEEVTLVM